MHLFTSKKRKQSSVSQEQPSVNQEQPVSREQPSVSRKQLLQDLATLEDSILKLHNIQLPDDIQPKYAVYKTQILHTITACVRAKYGVVAKIRLGDPMLTSEQPTNGVYASNVTHIVQFYFITYVDLDGNPTNYKQPTKSK